MRKFLLWVGFNVNLGPLNPWVIGLALGRIPHKVKKVLPALLMLALAAPALADDAVVVSDTTPQSSFVAGAWCPVYRDAPSSDDAVGCDMGVGVALAHRGPFAAVAAIGTKTIGAGVAWVVSALPNERPVAIVVGAMAPYDERGIDVGGWGVALGATFGFGGGDK